MGVFLQLPLLTAPPISVPQVARRLEPTIVNIKPRLPSWFLKSKEPEKRREYCRVKLLLHKPFLNTDDFHSYMETHGNDYEAAYEHFARHDPHAPSHVKDDYRELHIETEDGERLQPDELNPSEKVEFRSEYSLYRFMGKQELTEAQERSLPLFGDWAARTKQRYSPEQVKDADRWMQRTKALPSDEAPPTQIDVNSLNSSQRFAYAAIEHHLQLSTAAADAGPPPPPPFRALICGTAGSGKTYLIAALKQLLGNRCLVCAPTGVAADNIGGVTYQSKIPVPRDPKKLNMEDIRLPEDSNRLQALEGDFENVSYLIIDEMSMVGRRSLGQVDDLLRQAKGREQPFGGINVLLVGDHGQLPPVKDHRAFDWAGVRHKAASERGKKLQHAKMWEYHGTKMYELMCEHVFFLDKVERVGSSDDPVEAQRLQHFRELQLRARDGALTDADYRWMVEHMDAGKRAATFEGDDVYRLVTTRRLRDEQNFRRLEQQIHSGAPGIAIAAVNSSDVIQRVADDDLGLHNNLLLCIGSRVMITKNISVAHGLCNGTMGTVYDIMCNAKGDVVAVLLRVKRRTEKQRGYAGPSFLDSLPETDGTLSADEAIIALDRWTEKVYENGAEHQRSQFPLMLAACVTMHKAQGLTLDRVLIDAGPDEKAMGQLFVALTRVRHPDHVAFSPLPTLARVTTLIACKNSLYERKRHERHLRGIAAQTAHKLVALQPTGFVVGAIPPEPPKPRAIDPSQRAARQGTLGDWQQNETARAAATRAHIEQQQRAAAKLTKLRAQRAQMERQLQQNRAVVVSLGLPDMLSDTPFSEQPLPPWLQQALPLLKLRARVVDFLPSNRAAEVTRYLQHLGFVCSLDDSASQVGNTCGVVSARVIADVSLAHMDGISWDMLDVSRAVDDEWYRTANPSIGMAANNTSDFISGTQVMTALQQFWNDEMASRDAPSRDVYEWCPPPESIDFGLRQLTTDLHEVVCGQQPSFEIRARCSNTDTCLSRGTHWFTIVYSIECVNGHEQQWDAVRTAAAIFTPQVMPIRRDDEENKECCCPLCGSADLTVDNVDTQCNECGESWTGLAK